MRHDEPDSGWLPLMCSGIDRAACEYIKTVLELDAFSIGLKADEPLGFHVTYAAVAAKGGKTVVIGPMSEDEFRTLDKFNMICRISAELGETPK